jgi:hypothetical protein
MFLIFQTNFQIILKVLVWAKQKGIINETIKVIVPLRTKRLHNEVDIPKPFNVWRRETNFISIYFLLLYRAGGGGVRHDVIKALLFNVCENQILSENNAVFFSA